MVYLSRLFFYLGLTILEEDLFRFTNGFSTDLFLRRIIIPNKSIRRKTHHVYKVGRSQAKIRIFSPSIASTYYQDIEVDGLLNFEARRNQRLKRLEKYFYSETNFDIERPQVHEDKDSVERLDKSSKDFILGPYYMQDASQQNSIISDAPAILLQSSAGTGKTTALAGRVAYLIQSLKIQPQNMIILSFTNKDANALKEKALDILTQQNDCCSSSSSSSSSNSDTERKKVLEKNLWSGTIHSFAINILQQYNTNNSPLRIISTREMKNRIRQCLGRINTMSHERMMMYKNALIDSKQSIGTLVQYILRCLELWKEAGVLPSPYLNKIKFSTEDEDVDKQRITRDDFIELAMRLGIPESTAVLAYSISGDYQTLHASSGTSDPADVATIAYEYLLNNPKSLNKIRSKLHQVILDEYQDVSVSQHRLLRLVITGNNGKEENQNNAKLAILADEWKGSKPIEDVVCYHVPKLCAAGDANQSIYGWRGAAPSLTVEGFRRDFPQGIVVPLNTSYRLPRNILNAANVLLGYKSSTNPLTFDTSPAAIKSKKSLIEKHTMLQLEGVMNESKSSVAVQGLWDKREEAKFIAKEIRKRAKERTQMCQQALEQLGQADEGDEPLFDSSDVAIMVRSSNEMEIFKQALQAYGIPYKVPSEDKRSVRKVHYRGRHEMSLLSMKPCKIITMHQAKGDEFDDVYLASWSEGNFPHPSSLQTNRIHEERRIAYVALTRARQRVMISYPYMERKAYFGPNGERKDVTEQVEPSRFLYDLIAIKDKDGVERVLWNDSVGFKEVIAGKDLPSHFAKSYRIPNGYSSHDAVPKSGNIVSSSPSCQAKEVFKEVDSVKELKIIKDGLKSIYSKVQGSSKKYRSIFLQMLKQRGILRGRAVILKELQHDLEKDIQTLSNSNTSSHQIDSRPLSRCTATQLGLYAASLIHKDANC